MALSWAPVLVTGLILFGLATLLAWRGMRNASAWMVVLVLLGHASTHLLAGYFAETSLSTLYRPARWFFQSIALGALFGVVAAWPSYALHGWRRALAMAGALPPLLALFPVLAVLYQFDPTLALPGLRPYTFTTHTVAHLSNWSLPFLLALVAAPYLRLPAGPLRSQYYFLLLFLAPWIAFGGVHLVMAGGPFAYVGAGWFQLLSTLVFLGLIGYNIHRRWEFRSRPQDIVLAVAIVSVLVFALIPATGSVRNFYLLSALLLVVLFFGIARYQILGVDLRIPSITGRSLKTAIVVPSFFVLLQLVEVYSQNLLGDTGGTAAGLVLSSIVTGVLVFGLSRLEAVLGAGQGVPRVDEPLAAYDTYRRIEMYRAALDAIMADGAVDEKERRMLERLRESLGITAEEHYALERQARVERAERVVALP